MVTINVNQEKECIEVETNNKKSKYNLQKLPDDFIQWQINERIKLFDDLKNRKQPKFLSSHLPTLVTINNDRKNFPVNAVCKGLGLVTIDIQLNKVSDEIKAILNEINKIDIFESIDKRIQGAMLLYDNKEKINKYALGGLEIFETKTYNNITMHNFKYLYAIQLLVVVERMYKNTTQQSETFTITNRGDQGFYF